MMAVEVQSSPALDAGIWATESTHVRQALYLPPHCGTVHVIQTIESLIQGRLDLIELWDRLFQVLHLSPSALPEDALNHVQAYISECQYMRSQEKRHLGIISKLQQDKAGLLRRFHVPARKPSMLKIREKSLFIGSLQDSAVAELSDKFEPQIDEEDETGTSLEESQSLRTSQIHSRYKAKTSVTNSETSETQTTATTTTTTTTTTTLEPIEKSPANNNLRDKILDQKQGFEISLPLIKNTILTQTTQNQKIKKNVKPTEQKLPLPNRSRNIYTGLRKNVTEGTRDSHGWRRGHNKSREGRTANRSKQGKLIEIKPKPLSVRASASKQRTGADPSQERSVKLATSVSPEQSKIIDVTGPTNIVTSKPVMSKKCQMLSKIKVGPEGGSFTIEDLNLTVFVPRGTIPEASIENIEVGLEFTYPQNPQLLNGPEAEKLNFVTPIITVQPEKILKKPIFISAAVDSGAGVQQQLVLYMDASDTGSKQWEGVSQKDGRFVPVLSQDKVVFSVDKFGKYAAGYQNVPASLTMSDAKERILQFILLVTYDSQPGNNTLNLHLYCLKDSPYVNQVIKALQEPGLASNKRPLLLDQERVKVHGDQCEIDVTIDDLMDGWSVIGQQKQTFQADDSSFDLNHVMTISLLQEVEHLRCILGKMTLKQKTSNNANPVSLNVCVDLDQLDPPKNGNNTPVASQTHQNKTTNETSRSAKSNSSDTLLTKPSEDESANRKFLMHQGEEMNGDALLLKIKVCDATITENTMPAPIKSELAKMIQTDTNHATNWIKLLSKLHLEGFQQLLQEKDKDTGLFLLNILEIRQVPMEAVLDALGNAGYHDAAVYVQKYLAEKHQQNNDTDDEKK